MTIRLFVALSVAAVWTGGAAAAPVRFAGEGVVTRSTGTIPATGTVAQGDAVRFSFSFDVDDATAIFVSPDFAAYTLPFGGFSASLGGYAFTPEEPTARVSVGRGFTFLGQPFSEPVRFFEFSFRGTSGPGAPFAGDGFEQFSVQATLRDLDPARPPVSLADLRDPTDATRRTFSYLLSAPGGPPPRLSVLDGTYQGAFAAAVVPEPAAWALMIAGVGAVGGALRRRRAVAGRDPAGSTASGATA